MGMTHPTNMFLGRCWRYHIRRVLEHRWRPRKAVITEAIRGRRGCSVDVLQFIEHPVMAQEFRREAEYRRGSALQKEIG